MRHAVLAASILASLATLPGCLPIGGCGGAGDHTMVVGGPVTITLTGAKPTTYTFEVDDPSAFTLTPDDASITVRAAELDPTDFQATGTVSLADGSGYLDLDLTFDADGTLTGTASRSDGTSREVVSYAVAGTFQPVYQ